MIDRRVGALLVGLLTCGVGGAWAQSVRGTVTDRATGNPVTGAAVTLWSGGAKVADATTDAEGRYHFSLPAAGAYRVRFQAPGYRLIVSPEFTVGPSQTQTVPLWASPVPPVALDTATVEASPSQFMEDFYRHKATGLGTFVLHDEWERYDARQVSDVIRQAGVFEIRYQHNDPSHLYISSRRRKLGGFGPCPPLVFLNGLPLGNTNNVAVDDVMLLDGIDALEFYEGVEVPIEYAAPGSECGALVAWTRVHGPGEAARVAHRIEVGAQFGGRLAAGGLQTGRAGVQGGIGLIGPIMGHLAFNVLIAGLHGGALPQTGWEMTMDLRARPLGADSPWYVGAGLASLNLHRQGGGSLDLPQTEDQSLVLTGLSIPLGWLRPMVELQVRDPLTSGSRQAHVFTGLTIRLQ